MDPDLARQIVEIGKSAGPTIGVTAMMAKILGPTADYLGQGLKNWTERGYQNLTAVFENAERKLGDRIEEEGSVPPRVLKQILEEGSFSEDTITQEYFGGVLASSRTDQASDDRGAVMAQVISRMSTYQIRAHYVFYTLIKQLCDGSETRIGSGNEARLDILVPMDEWDRMFDEDGLGKPLGVVLTHILFGLSREELIKGFASSADPEELQRSRRVGSHRITCGGIIITPSAIGAELYLWAHGMGETSPFFFLDKRIAFDPLPGIYLPAGATRISVDSE